MSDKPVVNSQNSIFRRFSNAKERAAAINGSLIIGITVFYVVISIFALIQLSQDEIVERGIQYFLLVSSVLFGIINWILFLKDKESEKFYVIVTLMYLFMYTVSLLAGDYSFLRFSIMAVLILSILFYNFKTQLILCLAVAVINIVYFGKWIIELYSNNQVSSFLELSSIARTQGYYAIFELLYIFGIVYTLIRTTNHGELFNRDIFGTISDEHNKQKEILDDVLAISGVIQQNTTVSNEIVVELGALTETVNCAINQISTSTQLTAQSILQQSVMTKSIQDSINDTVSRSKKMVSIANDSNASIDSSLNVMQELKSETQQIAKTNQNLVQSMAKLQEKTREVQNIAEIIKSISEQTNLLSLNASIESARAGEAGKGFAVVANEIRTLSEQTKTATENIAKILKELNNYAEIATNTVNDTITVSNHQSQLISEASDNFNRINLNVSSLATDISSIDSMLANLANANETIVEDISQISATTQEITASSQEATAISEKNTLNAENAKKLLNEILETSHKLDKYY